MKRVRTVAGGAEIAAAFLLTNPVMDMLNNDGHHGTALVAGIGGLAIGVEGILRTGEGLLNLPAQQTSYPEGEDDN